MKLISNNIEIPVDEKADIILEKFSPILNLDVKGEYALSFNNQITPELQQAMGFSNLPNIEKPVSKIPVALTGDSLIFLGDLTTQSANRFQYQQQLTATPGGVPLDVWNRKLTEIDFGKDTIPTTITNANYYQLITTTTGNTSTLIFKNTINSARADVKIYFNNTEVYAKTFAFSASQYYDSLSRTNLETFVSDFNDAIKQDKVTTVSGGILIAGSNTITTPAPYPNTTMTLSGDELIIYAPYTAINTIKVVITRPAYSIDRGVTLPAVNATYTFTRITYQSIGNYFDKSLLPTWTKPYLLPPIYAPNAYSDNNKTYNGTLNVLNGTNYQYNTDSEPTTYAFCPVFKFQYILTTLLSYMGYTLNPLYFAQDNNDKLYWHTMVLADQQCPNLSQAFNIHASEIIYQNHLPDWTVKEFIERFQNWQNVYIAFDVFTKTATIHQRQKPFVATNPQTVINIQDFTDDDYTASPITNEAYQNKYAITESDDETLKSTLFKPYPETQTKGTDWVEIVNHFAPLIFSTDYAPTSSRTRGNGSTPTVATTSPWNFNRGGTTTPTTTTPTVRTGIITCYQSARSPMFSKSNEDVKSRALFVGVENQTILTENTLNTRSLFITGTNGLYNQYFKKYLDAITNTIEIVVKVSLPNITLHQFDFSSIFHAFGMAWLANQISVNPKLRASVIRLRRIKPS